MVLFVGFFTVLFVVLALSSQHPEDATRNPLSLYSFNLWSVIRDYFLYFFIGFVILVVSYSRSHHISSHFHLKKKYLTSLYHVFIIGMMGFFIAFIALFVIAFLELNFFSVLTYINPKLLGIETRSDKIVDVLQSGVSPKIMASQNEQKRVLYAVAISAAEKTSFYGGSILPTIPSLFILPMKQLDSSIYLVDDTVIITSINSKKVQQATPYLGYLLVQQYFPRIAVKHYPKVALMSQQEYFLRRDEERQKRIEQLDLQIIDTVSMLGSISGTLKSDEELMQSLDATVKELSSEKSLSYRKCRSQGSSRNGVFTPSFTKEYCEELVATITARLEQAKKDHETTKKKLLSDQDVQKRYQLYDRLFKQQKSMALQSVKNIPNEYGVFTPPDTIKLSLHRTDSQSLADYLATLTHEYLHYASYVSDKKLLSDGFFEEGLTEYFARKIVEKNLNIETNIGYPVYYKIISEMTNIIPETELAVIYFTKDQNALVSALDRVYGDNFYQNNRILFASLQFTSNRNQTLQIANEIMKKINGTPLTLQDLRSSSSELN